MKTLTIIPARSGSKGLPKKNIMLLNGKTLIEHTLQFALENKNILGEICLTTNDKEIIKISKNYDIEIPFIRPKELCKDNIPMREVILHALNFYENKKNKVYDRIILLQPTSPFRNQKDLYSMNKLWNSNIDLVVSVFKTKSNPYFKLFKEFNGFITPFSNKKYNTRQDCPTVYELNGSIYIITVDSIKKNEIFKFKKIVKYEMFESKYNLDIDSSDDFEFAKLQSLKADI